MLVSLVLCAFLAITNVHTNDIGMDIYRCKFPIEFQLRVDKTSSSYRDNDSDANTLRVG